MNRLLQNELIKFWSTRAKWLFFICALFPILMAMFFIVIIGLQCESAVEFINNVEIFRISITIFAISVGGVIFANEYSHGTIKFLMIRPISRTKVFLTKWLFVMLSSLVLLLIIVVASFLIGSIWFGFDSFDSQAVHKLLLNYVSELARFMTMASFAMLLAIFFRNAALGIGITMAITFGFIVLILFLEAANENWARFLLFSNLDLKQYFFGNDPMFTGMSLPFSIGIIVIHIFGFVVPAWYIFKERDIGA